MTAADHFRNFSLTHTYLFSPNLLNQAEIAYNRQFVNLNQEEAFRFSDVGVTAPAFDNPIPAIQIVGALTLGGNGQTIQVAQNAYIAQDDLVWSNGHHSFRLGGGVNRGQLNIDNFHFLGGLVFGTFPDFLLGQDGTTNGTGLSNVLATIDVPFAGSVGTQLDGINNSGIITGLWVDEAFTAHGFVYEKGNFAHLDYPGALDTFPYGINSRGDIVGNWDADQSTVGHGFVFSNGQIFSIDVPDAVPDGTAANGINDRGQVVGSFIGEDGNSYGFLAEGSTFTTLDCAEDANTRVWGINSAGQIAGTCDLGGQRLGFVANRTPMRKP